MLHQLDVVNRCNNTNNFAEATIHILKDVILGRQTAFNTVAFVEFCTAVWEPYMIRRLLNVAHNRDARGRLVYSELMKRCDKLDVLAVTRLDDDTYIVPSTKHRDVHCSVSVALGVCECHHGRQGAFCKHQAFVHSRFGELFRTCHQ